MAGGDILIELPFPSAKLSGHNEGHWTDRDIKVLRDGYARGEGTMAIAHRLGRSRAAVRNQAYKLEITTRDDAWTKQEVEQIRGAYRDAQMRGEIGLTALSERLNRQRASICRKARELGLTNPRRPCPRKPKRDRRKYKTEAERSKARTETLRARHRATPHPMLGKKHTPEAREKIRSKVCAFAARETLDQKSSRIGRAMRTKVERYGTIAPLTERGTWKAGWREIATRHIFFRSRWEANYARYLQWLKDRGDIIDWEYEPETFWFDAIKRGVRSYKPDFRVHELNGSKPLHEVKGWMDARSKTTLKRMAKYHPQETIILIREKEYKAISRFSAMIGGWE